MGVPERKEQEKGEEKLFKLKMAENFLNLLEKKKKSYASRKLNELQVDLFKKIYK